MEWKHDLIKTTLGSLEIGGGRSLPLLYGPDSDSPRSPRPLIGLEMDDSIAGAFPEALAAQFDSKVDTVAEWLELIQGLKPDFVSICLSSANRDTGNRKPEESLAELASLAPKISLPLVLWGSEDEEVDRFLLPEAAKIFSKTRIAIGPATETCYLEIAKAAMEHDHLVIALSPLDINLAKQLNLLLKEAGLPPERSIIFPTTGALGYGLEYAFSTMERTRIEGLKGDAYLAQPMLAVAGREAWKAKETQKRTADEPIRHGLLGKENSSVGREFEFEMGVSWESVTGMAMVAAGADLVIMRGPVAALALKDFISTKLGKWS
jgi:acetyl-CoA decarbonylase/synthase, CODH/ACS complex subunit delta